MVRSRRRAGPGHRPRSGLGRRRQLLGPLLGPRRHRPLPDRQRRPGAVLDGPERTWSGTGLQYPEAPHLFEHEGTWYLLIAEGGTERGHCVSVARGPSPVGPWEGAPANPILSHRSTDTPIQNTGHGDLVEQPTDRGGWSCSASARGASHPASTTLGRETFLDPGASGTTAWPVTGRPDAGDAMTAAGCPTRPARDRADARTSTAPRSDPTWVGRPPPPGRGELADHAPGLARLARSRSDARHSPNRPSSAVASSTTSAGAATRVELGVGGGSRAERPAGRQRRTTTSPSVATASSPGPASDHSKAVVGSAHRPAVPVVLTIETGPDMHGPGHGRPSASRTTPAPPTRWPELDGRYLSTEVTGGFLGRMIGMYAVGGDGRLRLVRLRGGMTVATATPRRHGRRRRPGRRLRHDGVPRAERLRRRHRRDPAPGRGGRHGPRLPGQHRGAGAGRRTFADPGGDGRRDRAVRPLAHALRH